MSQTNEHRISDENFTVAGFGEIFLGAEEITDSILQKFIDLKDRLAKDDRKLDYFEYRDLPDEVDDFDKALKNKIYEAQLREIALKSSVSLIPPMVARLLLDEKGDSLPNLEQLSGVAFSLRLPLKSFEGTEKVKVRNEIKLLFEEYTSTQNGLTVDADTGLINGILFTNPTVIVDKFTSFYNDLVEKYTLEPDSYNDIVFGLATYEKQKISLVTLGEKDGIKYLGVGFSAKGPVSPVNNATKNVPDGIDTPPFLFVSTEQQGIPLTKVRNKAKGSSYYVATEQQTGEFLDMNEEISPSRDATVNELRGLQKYSVHSFIPPKIFEKWFLETNSQSIEDITLMKFQLEFAIDKMLPDISGHSSISEFMRNNNVEADPISEIMQQVTQEVLKVTPFVSNFAGDSIEVLLLKTPIEGLGISLPTDSQKKALENFIENFAETYLEKLEAEIQKVKGGSEFIKSIKLITNEQGSAIIKPEDLRKYIEMVKNLEKESQEEDDIASNAIKKLFYIALMSMSDKKFGFKLEKSENEMKLRYERLPNGRVVESIE